MNYLEWLKRLKQTTAKVEELLDAAQLLLEADDLRRSLEKATEEQRQAVIDAILACFAGDGPPDGDLVKEAERQLRILDRHGR